MTGLTRSRYLFSPWWRIVWLIGGIAWLIVLNALFIGTGARNQWLGVASVIPVLALLIDVIVRDRRWHREHQQNE